MACASASFELLNIISFCASARLRLLYAASLQLAISSLQPGRCVRRQPRRRANATAADGVLAQQPGRH